VVGRVRRERTICSQVPASSCGTCHSSQRPSRTLRLRTPGTRTRDARPHNQRKDRRPTVRCVTARRWQAVLCTDSNSGRPSRSRHHHRGPSQRCRDVSRFDAASVFSSSEKSAGEDRRSEAHALSCSFTSSKCSHQRGHRCLAPCCGKIPVADSRPPDLGILP